MKKPNCLNSDSCTLWQTAKNPFVPLTGNRKNPKVIFVGEAPGFEDDIQNANFVGKAEQLFRSIIKEIGFLTEDIAFSNIVRCIPLDYQSRNRTPLATEISKCSPHSLAEIEVLKPLVVVLLGNTPLKSVLGETGITNKRGRLYEQSNIKYVPTYHPAAIWRDPSKTEDFVRDLEFAYSLLKPQSLVRKAKATPVNYVLVDSKSKLIDVLKTAEQAVECSFDLETTCLSPFTERSKIVCVNLSFYEREAFVIPYYHSTQIFTGKLLEFAKGLTRDIMESSVEKIAHNGKFDMLWLLAQEGVEVNNFVFDTMLAQYLLYEERGNHSLDYLAWAYTDMGGYDEPLAKYVSEHKEANPKLGGSYANIPWPILFPYSAGDSDCTLRSKHQLQLLLENIK